MGSYLVLWFTSRVQFPTCCIRRNYRMLFLSVSQTRSLIVMEPLFPYLFFAIYLFYFRWEPAQKTSMGLRVCGGQGVIWSLIR